MGRRSLLISAKRPNASETTASQVESGQGGLLETVADILPSYSRYRDI